MTEQSRVECRFIESPTHRFDADRIDEAEDYHLVSQQSQRPMASATRWVSTANWISFCSMLPLILILSGRAGCGL